MSLIIPSTGPTQQAAKTAHVGVSDSSEQPVAEAIEIRLRRHGQRCWVVTVAGELDVATAPDLMETLRSVLEEEPERLVIDLDQVTFLDSTGLGVLISAYRRMSLHDGGLVLVCHNRRSLRVMELTGLTRLFAFAPSADEAVTGPQPSTDARSDDR